MEIGDSGELDGSDGGVHEDERRRIGVEPGVDGLLGREGGRGEAGSRAVRSHRRRVLKRGDAEVQREDGLSHRLP